MYCLILHPAPGDDTAHDTAQPARLVDTITAMGLAGPPLPAQGPDCYAAGARFLELLTFLGCAPEVALEPVSGTSGPPAFCFVRLQRGGHGRQLLRLRDTVAARCPACRTAPAEWRADAPGVDTLLQAASLSCPGCGAQLAPAQLDWRREAGLCDLRIEITNIHPHEAVPGEQLLARLGENSGRAWDYFYCRRED